jgi:hypothetical protein
MTEDGFCFPKILLHEDGYDHFLQKFREGNKMIVRKWLSKKIRRSFYNLEKISTETKKFGFIGFTQYLLS